MPVAGLSEARRLPRLGKLRLGIKQKSQGGKEYPKAVDYFVCPPEVQEVHGEKPRFLPVILPAQDVEANLRVDLKRYGASRGLICKGNGETASVVNTETGELTEQECLYKECPHYQKKDCKEIGILSFLLPEVPGMGVWQIATSSINSILNLQSEMALAKRVCGGRLAGLPFELRVEPQDAYPNGKKKTIYVMHLRSPFKMGQLRALPPFESVGPLALPSFDEIPEELYPEIEAQRPAEEPATEQASADTVSHEPRKPLNANGDSELDQQRAVHIAAGERGLTKEGAHLWLRAACHVDSTKDLTKEECMAAIAEVGKLTDPQVEGYNRTGATQNGKANGEELFPDKEASA